MTDVCASVQYVVEIDGTKHSEYARFVDAVKAGLLLREQKPDSKIRVRDACEPKLDAKSELAA